jgi:hypothetical protein
VRLTLILNEREAEALRQGSVREDRPARDQARRLLRESLERAGWLEVARTNVAGAQSASAVTAY